MKFNIRVTFDNGNTLTTGINADSRESVEKYYLNQEFNVGRGEEDLIVRAIKVEFL